MLTIKSVDAENMKDIIKPMHTFLGTPQFFLKGKSTVNNKKISKTCKTYHL